MNAVTANIPSLLQQIDTSSLDLGDILGVIIGSIALVVSAVTFYISYTKTSQSEQVKTSRDLWDGIIRVYNKYEETWRINEDRATEDEVLSPVLVEIDYFAYLIVKGELKDRLVFDYYGEKLKRIITTLLDRYPPEFKQYRKSDKYIHLRRLIRRWNIEVPK